MFKNTYLGHLGAIEDLRTGDCIYLITSHNINKEMYRQTFDIKEKMIQRVLNNNHQTKRIEIQSPFGLKKHKMLIYDEYINGGEMKELDLGKTDYQEPEDIVSMGNVRYYFIKTTDDCLPKKYRLGTVTEE